LRGDLSAFEADGLEIVELVKDVDGAVGDGLAAQGDAAWLEAFEGGEHGGEVVVGDDLSLGTKVYGFDWGAFGEEAIVVGGGVSTVAADGFDVLVIGAAGGE
jgi:hypothetical protein